VPKKIRSIMGTIAADYVAAKPLRSFNRGPV